MIVVEIILKKPNGEVLARVEGNAHEPLRWSEPIVDEEARLQLLRVLYDPDSRPLPPDDDDSPRADFTNLTVND